LSAPKPCTITRVGFDGRTWPYLEGGDPSKPTLVMVHGFGADKDHWTFYAPWLTKDYRLIAPDLPGFGENDRDGELPFDVGSQAARLKDFLDALGIDRPHLGGNSMGGWIALRFAIDYPDALKHRDLLDKIFWTIADEMEAKPLNDELHKVTVPTLIIWGRHDKLIDVSCVAVLEKGIADSRSHIFEHIAHVPMIEDPKATAEVQRAFLASH